MRRSDLFIISLLISGNILSQSRNCESQNANWNRDGSKIIFDGMRNGRQGIYLLDLHTNAVSLIVDRPGRDAHAFWSPDGKTISFQSTRDTTSTFLVDIYTIVPGDSSYRKLVAMPGFSGVPSWSPDGTKIAFQFMPMNSWAEFKSNNWQIYVMDKDGSNQRQLTFDNANNQVPNWSPDGKSIIYYSNRNGKDQIFRMNADGTADKQLRKSDFDEESACFSPDGQWIAFKTKKDGLKEICSMNSEGGDFKKLTTAMSVEGVPTWSPDGKRIVFQSAKTGVYELYSVDIETGILAQLTNCK